MAKETKHLLEFGPFRVDPDQRLLLRDGQPIPLSPKAFELLLALMQRSGQVVLKDHLMQILWPDTFVEESNLGQQVFQLRKALGERPQDHSFIVTVPGRGYQFVQQVRALPEEEILLVASRTRSRVIIEEGERLDQPAEPLPLRDREVLALPPVSSRWSRAPILTLVCGAAFLAAVTVWLFTRPAPQPNAVRSLQITSTGRVEPFRPPLSDGSRVFFVERFGGLGRLAQVSEQGGETTSIPTSVENLAVLDLDRVHGRLLVTSVGEADTPDPVWVVPTAGGSARRLGEVVARQAAWSPDGQQIAYALGADLFLVGDDGQRQRHSFTAPGGIEHPRWFPEGHRISFTVRAGNGTTSVWEVDADGRNAHSLSFGWKAPEGKYNVGECCGDWSPDGRYFVFRSARDGAEGLWVLDRKKSWFGGGSDRPVPLYAGAGHLNNPRFSADGKKILYVNYREQRELARYDSARGMFVPYLNGIPARHLGFSRDGQWVAYTNPVDGTLWRSRVDGTQKLQLTFPPLETMHATWSPDGTQIAFQGRGSLYVISRDGGNPERLLPEDIRGGQPHWSPDGKSLVFTCWDRETGVNSTALLNLQTRQVQILPESEHFEGPHWSNDGRYIAAGDQSGHKLMLFDVANRRWSKLADGTPYGWGIRWSSDSKYVYYQLLFAGEEQPIFRARVSDRKVEQVTSSRQMPRADVLSFSMTGLAPDDAPLVSLVHKNSDIFALELSLP